MSTDSINSIIDLARPPGLSISGIISVLDKHFRGKYLAEGASRLSTLAIHAAYGCLVKEIKRFEGKSLIPIADDSLSDFSSERIGDVNLIEQNGRLFEAVEIQFGIPISLGLVQDTCRKIRSSSIVRFYLLSTVETIPAELLKIEEEIAQMEDIHGCQIIVDGIIRTLEYNLRLLDDTYEFIENYVNLLENDTSIKFEHKERWNQLIGGVN